MTKLTVGKPCLWLVILELLDVCWVPKYALIYAAIACGRRDHKSGDGLSMPIRGLIKGGSNVWSIDVPAENALAGD